MATRNTLEDKQDKELKKNLRRYVDERTSVDGVSELPSLTGPMSLPAVPITEPVPVRRFEPNNEQAYNDPLSRGFRDTFGENVVTSAIDNIAQASRQAQKNVVSGVLQIPSDVAGMVDLVGHGVPALIQSIPDNPEQDDDNYFSRLSENFTNSILPPAAQEELAAKMQSALSEYQTAFPTATDAEIDDFLHAYQDTDEFFDYMSTKLPPGLRIAQQGNRWANEIVGLGKRPDQQTSIDEIEQIVGQSIIGIPSAVTKGVMSAARRKLGDAVLDNTVSRIALKAAEIATPVTFPLTPGNIAANAVVGSTINEALRVAQNVPNVLQGGIAELTPEELEEVPELATLDPDDFDTLPVPFIEEADGHGVNVAGQIDEGVVAAGVSVAAIFGMPAFRRQAAQKAAQKAQAAIDKEWLRSGATLAEQSSDLDPILSPIAGLASSQAPIRRGANQFELQPQYQGRVTKGQMIEAIDAQLSAASSTNVIDSVANVVNHGVLSNYKDTVPVMTIRRAAESLSPDDRALLDAYAFAKQRQQDDVIKMQSLDESIRQTQIDLSGARIGNQTRQVNSLVKKLAELQSRRARLLADDPVSRNMFASKSRADVYDTIQRAEANPNVMGVAELQRRSGHDMLNYAHANGYLTSEEVSLMTMNRDFWFPVRERAHPNVNNPLLRKGLLFADRIKGKTKEDTDFYTVDATRNLDERLSGKVNHPKQPILALQEAWGDMVRSVTQNNARRQVIDTLRTLDGAEGTMFRQFTFNNRKSFSKDEYFSGVNGLREAVENRRVPLTRIIRDGKFEFYEFSDPSMSSALEFAAPATVGIMNESRKIWQNMTTGVFAPWFAVKSVTWDTAVARVTMNNGRSLGLLDTYARKLAESSRNPAVARVVNSVMDFVPDPTAAISVAARIPYAMSMRAVRSVGHKIAEDLALNSGMFAQLAKLPGGQKLLNDVGTAMVKMFDRSVFNIYNRGMSTTMGLLQENTRILDDLNLEGSRRGWLTSAAQNVVTTAAVSAVTGVPVPATWTAFKAMVESVQGAARLAFFAENYGRLKQLHGGNIPQGELTKLYKETRDLSGDMSQYSGNKHVQKFASAFAYINPTIQGTRHILGAMLPPSGAKAINKLTGGKANLVEERTNRFWPQFIGGVLLPAIGSYAVLSDWQGALEYWENNVPEWRQISGIPIPTAASVMYRIENGEWPPFSEEAITVLEVPPELQVILSPVMAGLRAMGLVNNPTRVPSDLGHELRGALMTLVNLTTPLVGMYGAATGNRIDMSEGRISETPDIPFGGANADMKTYNSNMSQQLYEMIGAMFSSAGTLFAQTFDVFDMSFEETEEFGQAFERANETFKAEVTRRVPDVPGLWNSPTREYSFTPESEYVFDTMNSLGPVITQQTVETDSKDQALRDQSQGMTPPKKISDPLLKELTQTIYDATQKKGTFKDAGDEYNSLRKDLAALEASRASWSEEAYHAARNELVKGQQSMKQIQAAELMKMNDIINTVYGDLFVQQYGVPFSYEKLSDLVRQNVRE